MGRMPDCRAVPASGAACSAVTWRGLPGTNTKPANAAGRAARRSAPRLRSAHLGAAENELSRRLRRFARTRISDEPTRKASTRPESRSTSLRLTMPDSETSRRSGARPASRSVVERSMREIAQVAVIDADQRRSERQRAAHLALRHEPRPAHPCRSAALRRSSRALRRRPASDSMTRTASAPAIRASTTCRRSMKKSLARIGPSNRRRAAARSSSEPPK